MLTLSEEYDRLIRMFVPIFSKRIWHQVQVLLVGAILVHGQRTVTAALRIMGLSHDEHFQNYHRVLNRAVWSSLQVSRVLLGLLVSTFAARGPLVLGLDDTIERRRGAKIRARGIYRDPVRSSHGHFVKASGLRWLSLMLLVPIPWAKRVWALPFLTALAPSERYYQTQARAAKKLTDWARQMLLQVRRWLPERAVVVVADHSFAVLELLYRMSQLANPVWVVTRLRLDAALYEPAPPRAAGQKGRPRLKGKRLPTLQAVLEDTQTVWTAVNMPGWYGQARRQIEITCGNAVWYHTGKPPLPIRWVLIRDPKGRFKPQALLCTDQQATPQQMVAWFVRRWQVEVTFHEVRTHLGVETQRQWSDLAVARTTPALLGLFSLITLMAHQAAHRGHLPVQQAAWYTKSLPTFSDAIAGVRDQVWRHLYFHPSLASHDTLKIPLSLWQPFAHALCYTAY